MNKPDLLNSFDVLAIARRWPRADCNALDLASRLSTTIDLDAERARIEQAIPALRARERFWVRLAYLGYALVVVDTLLLALAMFGGIDLITPITDYAGRFAPKVAVIAGALWWILMLNLSVPARNARDVLEAKLTMLTPVVAGPACVAAAEYIAAGRQEVLAWRDIALYDRKELFGFDVYVLKALHHVSLAARSDAEKASAGEAAYQTLYGLAHGVQAQGATHDA